MILAPDENYRIIENFIPKSYSDIVFESITKSKNWMYMDYTAGDRPHLIPKDPNIKDISQMTQLIWGAGLTDGRPLDKIEGTMMLFLEQHLGFEVDQMSRIRANISFRQDNYPDHCYTVPHMDNEDPNGMVFLYYVNDSDGDTILFNERGDGLSAPDKLTECVRIKPKANTGVLFRCNQYHAPVPPRETPARFVINYVFK
jgi:hypothetical protein